MSSSLPDLWLHEPDNGRARLLEALRTRHQVVPFIGAGVSTAARVDLPGWSDFLKAALEKRNEAEAQQLLVEMEKSDRDLEEIAERMYPNGDRMLIKDIKDTFAGPFDPSQVKGPLAFLPDYFPTGMILTTNYDPLIENMFEAKGCTVDKRLGINFFDFGSSQEETGRIRVCKLHGDASGEELILLKRHYDKKYGPELSFADHFTQSLQKLIEEKTVLFLGASLTQDRTLKVFYDLYQKRHDDSLPDHFAFVTRARGESAQAQARRLREYGIEAFIYKPSTENHKRVEDYLKALLEEAKTGQSSLSQDSGTSGN